jgi:hypothetical protein
MRDVQSQLNKAHPVPNQMRGYCWHHNGQHFRLENGKAKDPIINIRGCPQSLSASPVIF